MIDFYSFYNNPKSLDLFDEYSDLIKIVIELEDESYACLDKDHVILSADISPIFHLFKPNPMISYYYAKDILKGRYYEMESIIMQDSAYAFNYARNVIKGRWIEAEEIIKTNIEYAYQYTKYIIKDRWFVIEEDIKKDPWYCVLYAKYIIKGRWFEVEDIIMTDSVSCYHYAQDVIQDRWIEAEPIMKEHYWAWLNYQGIFKLD
jgi:hypothetical protein